jgi:hypothetical protein
MTVKCVLLGGDIEDRRRICDGCKPKALLGFIPSTQSQLLEIVDPMSSFEASRIQNVHQKFGFSDAAVCNGGEMWKRILFCGRHCHLLQRREPDSSRRYQERGWN